MFRRNIVADPGENRPGGCMALLSLLFLLIAVAIGVVVMFATLMFMGGDLP